jgi:hypothetical protein
LVEKHLICGVLYQSCSTILQKRQSPREIRQVASKGKSPHFCQTLKTMLLQKRQTNEIFKGIQSVGLNPQEFDFEESGAERHFLPGACFCPQVSVCRTISCFAA